MRFIHALRARLRAIQGRTLATLAAHSERAYSRFREAVRAFAARSYANYLMVVVFFCLPLFLIWILPVGLLHHLREFVRELVNDIRSIDLHDFSRAAWEQNVRA